MSYYDLEKEKNKHPYDIFGGDVKEEVHDNKKFLLKQAMHFCVDRYGYEGSIDLSHYEKGNYYEVSDYIPLDDNYESLDLTWMDSDDIVVFDSSKGIHHKLIESVDMNIDNMDYSHFDSMKDIILNVHPGCSDIGFLEKVRRFKRFLHFNDDVVCELNLVDFNPLMAAILSNYAEKHGLKAHSKGSVRTR